MSEVHEEVQAWLVKQPDWLQEAADRLLVVGKLEEEDVAALAELLKTGQGQSVTTHRAFASLTQPAAAAEELRLTSISDVEGIENLSPNAPLDFGKGNLVVIYGHNGSGKSGYTRILKRVSGKPRPATLKANVFEEPPKSRQCTIGYQDGSSARSVDWTVDSDAVPALRAVDIFDSNEADHYLTKASAAGYVPPLVSMFEQLATACDLIKAQLQTQQDRLVSSLPALPAEYTGTESARRYNELTHTTLQTEIDQLTNWTDEHAASLLDLTERLRVTDPAANATQRRSKKTQVEKIATALKEGLNKSTDPALGR